MRSSIIFVIALLSIFTISSVSAADRNLCQKDGTLKGWAVKQGYTSEACTSASDSGSTDGGSDGTTDDSTNVGTGGGDDPCEGGSLKGWARKAGYDPEVCLSQTPTPNTAPTITITFPGNALTIEQGTPVTLAADANDAEDGNLSESVTWSSSLDSQISSGVVLSVGTHTITASVVDSAGQSAQVQTTVTITEASSPNTAPSIAITSPGGGLVVQEGTVVNFVAEANDVEDGDLSHSVEWKSSLDSQIGSATTLSAGIHEISAIVSDSAGESASANVTVEVTAKVTDPIYSVTLMWQAPKQREDGSALELSEIGGYEIYMIAQNTGDELVFSINDNNQTSYTIDGLKFDTYHFSIGVFDTNGIYSALSNPVSAIVQ